MLVLLMIEILHDLIYLNLEIVVVHLVYSIHNIYIYTLGDAGFLSSTVSLVMLAASPEFHGTKRRY